MTNKLIKNKIGGYNVSYKVDIMRVCMPNYNPNNEVYFSFFFNCMSGLLTTLD